MSPLVCRNTAWLFMMICCVLFHSSTVVFAQIDPQLDVFPAYWDTPGEIDYSIGLTEANSQYLSTALHIRIQSSYSEEPITPTFNLCQLYIQYDNGSSQEVGATFDSNNGWYILNYNRANPNQVLRIGFKCSALILQSATAAAANGFAYLSLEASYMSDEPDTLQSIPPVVFQIYPATPSLSHEIAWEPNNLPQGGSDNAGALSVKFRMVRPSAYANISRFLISHPLFSYDTITTPHISPTESIQTELTRKYMFLPTGTSSSVYSIQCISTDQDGTSSPSADSTIVFDVSTGDLQVRMTIPPIPPSEDNTAPATGDYICEFTVYVPPEVLLATFQQTPVTVSLSAVRSTGTDWEIDDTEQPFDCPPFLQPPTIPARAIAPSAGETMIIPSSVYIWTLPHYHSQYHVYEFSLAITHDYIDLDYQIKPIPNPPPVLTLGTRLLGNSVPPLDPSIYSYTCSSHAQNGQTMTIGGRPTIDLDLNMLKGFGALCEVKTIPFPDGAQNTLAMFMINGHLRHITTYDSLHRVIHPPVNSGKVFAHTSSQGINSYVTDMPDHGQLPSYPPAIPMIIETSDDDIVDPQQSFRDLQWNPRNIMITNSENHVYANIHVNIQYLPTSPLFSSSMNHNADSIFLHLIFPKIRNIFDLIPDESENIMASVTITSFKQKIFAQDVAVRVLDVNYHDIATAMDDISSIFVPLRPIRAPSIIIPLYGTFDPTQPLQVHVSFRIRDDMNNDITPEAMAVHPLVLPGFFSRAGIYRPEFAIITPVRATPLTSEDISFQCLKNWDKMTSQYIPHHSSHIVHDPTNNGVILTTISQDDLMSCPPVPQDEDMDQEVYWKKLLYIFYFDTSTITLQCYYTLPALCVSPKSPSSSSSSEVTEFNVHPLADCMELYHLHDTYRRHAVPCHYAQNPAPWTYKISYPGATYAHINDNVAMVVEHPSIHHATVQSGDVTPLPVVNLTWKFSGDHRYFISVLMGVGLSQDGNIGDKSYFPVSDALAGYLSPLIEQDKTTGHQVHIAVPPFLVPELQSDVEDSDVKLFIQLVVKASQDELQDFKQIITLPYGTYAQQLATLCHPDVFKMVDPETNLCVCQPGYAYSPTPLNLPYSKGSPHQYVHPAEFECLDPCPIDIITGKPQCKCSAEDEKGVDGKSFYHPCRNLGVCNPSTEHCTCMNGFAGDYCQNEVDPIRQACDELECAREHTYFNDDDDDDDDQKQDHECIEDPDTPSTLQCNCLPEYTGDQCQHAKVCGLRQCVNGRLVSPTGKPEECKCECNSTNITGTTCNQCTLACRNGGVANTRCTACQCPAGYIGTTCTIPVWYHTFTLRNLPQHIVELILGTTASDKEEMAILQQTMVKYLLEDYSRVLSETFIVVDGNGNGDQDGSNSDDTRIRVRVELSQFQTVIPPANPNAPYVHIQLMLYPADMTEEMLAYALQHGLVFDWSRVTDNLEFFRKFLREQGVTDDDLTPDIDDPGCTTRECRDKIIDDDDDDDDDSSNSSFVPLMAMPLSLSLCLVAMLSIFYG